MVLIVCFGKQFSVQFSEEQLEPLKVNCVSMSFFPSVALRSDCRPVKILNASNGFPFCRKSFKVQYPFTCTSVTRAHIEKTLLTVLNNGKALHFIWSFLKSEPNECFVNYPLLLKIYLHCLITECKFDALNTGSRGDVFVVRTSKPVENLWKNGLFWSRYSFVTHSIDRKPRDWGLARSAYSPFFYSALRASVALRATCRAPARIWLAVIDFQKSIWVR